MTVWLVAQLMATHNYSVTTPLHVNLLSHSIAISFTISESCTVSCIEIAITNLTSVVTVAS